MMKSYFVMKVPENINFIHMNKITARMVYCYNDNTCIHTRIFGSYEEADAFGLEYLDMDWEKFGFPDNTYEVPQKYLDYAKEIV